MDYGKQWEAKFNVQFNEQFNKTKPTYLLQRLYDQVTMYKDVSQNPADFYAMVNGKLVYIECKETGEGTLNFSKFAQLDRMLEKVQYPNVQAYVLIWFRKKKQVIVVSAQEADKIRQEGNKSIALTMLDKISYNIYEIPSVTKVTYPDCDWSKLIEVIDNDGQIK